jgi:hypothetical protein
MKQQEKERKRREQEAHDEREREALEGQVPLVGVQLLAKEKHGNDHNQASDDDRQGGLHHLCRRAFPSRIGRTSSETGIRASWPRSTSTRSRMPTQVNLVRTRLPQGQGRRGRSPAVLDAPGLWREPNELDSLR